MKDEQQRMLTQHVFALAEAHSIGIRWYAAGLRGFARNQGKGGKEIHVPYPRTPFTYLICLHELGHLIAPKGWWAPRIDREATAWQWAFEQSLLPITQRLRRAVKVRLDNYLTYGPSYRLKTPPPEAAFWRFYDSLS